MGTARLSWLTLTLSASLVLAAASLAQTAATDAPLRGPAQTEKAPAKAAPVSQSAPGDASLKKVSAHKVRTDKWIAYRLAKAPWLDKLAASDPEIVAAICEHPGPARLLAKHRHIADIAEADHYLCRRLTRWQGATWALIRNPHADAVIGLDPEGIYRAIDRNPKVARVLARHMMIDIMVSENPDLAKYISQHM